MTKLSLTGLYAYEAFTVLLPPQHYLLLLRCFLAAVHFFSKHSCIPHQCEDHPYQFDNDGTNRLVVIDAGIATEENILWLKEHRYDYIVVSRKKKIGLPRRWSLSGTTIAD
ncbi:MAG: hypothetical protein NTX75_01065 [Proteobacteria bacterium]|nr:hypothetical protein [Pseudomonadota bacterium]